MAWNAFGRFGEHAIAVRGGDEIRHERRWFADEVVIDFPSVAPAIERMRSAFLADEHVKTLTAALEISPREAREGATVPLDVPVASTFGRYLLEGFRREHPRFGLPTIELFLSC